VLIEMPTDMARRWAALRPLAALACCGVIAGCGGSSAPPPKPVAQRVCDGAQHAAAAALGHPVAMRIVNPAVSELECSLTGARVRVMVVSQATGQAYTEFDTETSHQSQVYGPAAAGVHQAGQIPSQTSVPGSVVAVWIRAQKFLVATNATPTTDSGSYLTVKVSGRGANERAALALARAVAQAAFAAHPNAPS
jgi:hypothetical protein